jgi:hypothetical protein
MSYSKDARIRNVKLALETVLAIEAAVAERFGPLVDSGSPELQRRIDRAIAVYCAERVADEVNEVYKGPI